MADSGIEEMPSVAFGGVLKMLSGKKYPQNARAFRMLVEEIIRPVFAKHHLECTSDLLQPLDDSASHSRITKLGMDCLIKPVFVILRFTRKEQETTEPSI